jgi:hypothetical protein
MEGPSARMRGPGLFLGSGGIFSTMQIIHEFFRGQRSLESPEVTL